MAFDLDNPFVQSIIQEGTSRGYSPMAIAASLGNAHVENKFNTGGTPGDNGTAFGGMQWRGDRYKNLQNTAAAMNVPWTDPKAQAAHWWNEMDGKYGSEGQYGKALKNASSIEDANDAVVNSLRPAGWHGADDNEDSLFYDQRKNNSSAILAAMNGGPNPDLASPNAQNAQGQGLPPGAPANMFGPKTDAPGGSLGETLMQIGGLMMSRGNPAGAQFIQTMLNNQRAQEKASADSWTTDTRNPVTTKDGKQYYTRTNSKTGQVTYLPIDEAHQPQEEADKPPPQRVLSDFGANNNAVNSTKQIIEEGHSLITKIADSNLDLAVDAQGKAYFRNLTNTTKEDGLLIKRAQAYFDRLAEERVNLEKGGVSNFRLTQAKAQFLPGGAQWSTTATMDSLQRAVNVFEEAHTNAIGRNQMYMDVYPHLSKSKAPGTDKTYIDKYQEDLQHIGTISKEARKMVDDFQKKTFDAQKAKEPTKPGEPNPLDNFMNRKFFGGQ